MSILTDRITRRPPESRIGRQFWNESLISRYGGTVTIVLSQLRTFTVFSVTSVTRPLTPYFDIEIQSPTCSISFAVNWIPDTSPMMLSLKTNIRIAAEAPSPASSPRRRLVDQDRYNEYDANEKAITCPVCISPFSGFPCNSSFWSATSCSALRKALTNPQHHGDHVDQQQFQHERHHAGFRRKGQRQQEIDQHRRHDVTQPPQHPVFEQDIVPGRLGARDDPLDHPQQQLPANEVRHESDRHDKTQHHPAIPYIGRLHGKAQFPQHPVHPFVYNRLHNSLFINSFRNNAVRLHVEQEMHDIAVLYDVLLAFDGDLTRLAARFSEPRRT